MSRRIVSFRNSDAQAFVEAKYGGKKVGLKALRDAARELVARLPLCECGKTATYCTHGSKELWCDACALDDSCPYPIRLYYADAIVKLEALLKEHAP